MPKLKQLEVQGFKSFAEPVTLLYPTGITAIVGPNGSGKSNVADAVRWALAEQRITEIRGRTNTDMIFTGSKKRARAGMARVAITFDNSDGWLPVDFAEVIFERRTYRDGKTEYLLNGSKLLLRDLRDLLERGGLGRDAYLIIGQGLVDQVLALRPQERLALFEQAAGITPYRTRREDAVRRLDDTRHNLERVYDIVGEIEPRLRRLERQADRVVQHTKLSADLNETLRIWYGHRWGRALAQLEQARQRRAYHEDKALQQLEHSEGITGEIAGQRQQLTELRAQLATLHRESSARHAEAEQRQRELAVARERQRQMQERQEESRAQLVPLRAALAGQTEDVATLEAEMAEVAARLEAEHARLAEADTAYHTWQSGRQGLLRRQNEAQAQALQQRRLLADRQSRLEQGLERLAQLTQRATQVQQALDTATERRLAQQAAVEAARHALETAEADLQALQAEAAQLEAAQEAARAERERLRRELNDREAALQQVAARLQALERLHAEGAGLFAGVRAVQQAVERGTLHGLPGPVAALMRVPSELDLAIETALGGQLQDIVAARWEDAQAAIEWLKRERAGRATFLPLDTLRPPDPLDVPRGSGVVGLASDLVEYDPRYQPAVLLLLGRTAITRTLDAARELYRKLHGGFRIVTVEGEIVRSGGAVTGGETHKAREGGLLARERERRELPEQVAALKQEIAGLRQALQSAEGQAQEAAAALRALSERQRVAENRRREADRAVERQTRDLDKLIQETAWQEKLLAEAGTERAGLAQSQTALEQERGEAETALAAAEAQLAALDEALAAHDEDESQHVVADRRTQVALVEQEHSNLRALAKSRRQEVERLERQIAGQEQRIRSLAGELDALAGQLGEFQARYDASRAAADLLAEQIPPQETQLTALETTLAALEEQERTAHRALREAEQRLSQAEVDANRREDQAQALRREIEDALGIVVGDLPESLSGQQPLPLEAIVAPLPIVAELPEGLRQQIHDLRTQIRRLEPVNPGAKAEYDELAERHTFLRAQMTDLESASANLRKIIAELDEMMDTLFRTTFKSIAKEFARIFELLFNGGTAKLTPLDSEDGNFIEGVEITARPPGKRTASLGMLSGGERTLTAVALLFAVMQVSPTPFCILDEVDAMLDEANVGRFRAMLRELARDTQFIIVTHNRGTVEVADTIYGVSMGDDSVSQVLSLSLEDLPPAEEI